VTLSELRQVLRLASELRDLPHGSREQKQHVLQGLCALVGAQLGIWLDLAEAGGGQLKLLDTVEHGWACERERASFVAYLDAQPCSVDPSHPPLSERMRRDQCVTVARRDVLGDREWYRAPHVQEYRRAGGVDDFIYAGRLVHSGIDARGLSLHRPWGDRPFRPRDVALVDAFTREALWLHEPTTELERWAQRLSPRLGDVLRGLARGLSEKQLADELQLSQHTVHDYVKALYRRIGVSSRGELLARLVSGRR
jgi:DNA-binding CsgD family transcriptional regulator